jgi:hypothetical protein
MAVAGSAATREDFMSVFHLKLRQRHWSLIHASTGSVLRNYRTFREALPASSADVERRGGCLVVYARDGSIQEWRRFSQPQQASAPP